MPSGEAWTTLRVVIEIKVPPRTPATEKHLVAEISKLLDLPASVLMPNPTHPRRQPGAMRVKSFASFWPAHARMQGWRKPATIRVPVED